jgi:hypothetical protein
MISKPSTSLWHTNRYRHRHMHNSYQLHEYKTWCIALHRFNHHEYLLQVVLLVKPMKKKQIVNYISFLLYIYIKIHTSDRMVTSSCI